VAGTERQRQLAAHAIRAIARVVLVLLALRIVLLLFAPSPDDQRVGWFLIGTETLEAPFRVVMPTIFIDPFSGSILDTVALTAIIGYALLEAGLVRALRWRPTVKEPLPDLPADLLTPSASGAGQPARPTRRHATPAPTSVESVPTAPVAGQVHSSRRP